MNPSIGSNLALLPPMTTSATASVNALSFSGEEMEEKMNFPGNSGSEVLGYFYVPAFRLWFSQEWHLFAGFVTCVQSNSIAAADAAGVPPSSIPLLLLPPPPPPPPLPPPPPAAAEIRGISNI